MGEASNIKPLKFNASDFSEDLLHTILELVSDGIWDWNANTGFVYRNPGWYKMLGYEPHSLDNTALTWENLIHPDDYPAVMAVFDDYVQQRAPTYQAEYRCRMLDGSYTWIEDRGYVLSRNADGSVARMIGAHRSIDDKRRLLEALNDALTPLKRQLKSAPGNCLGSISSFRSNSKKTANWRKPTR